MKRGAVAVGLLVLALAVRLSATRAEQGPGELGRVIEVAFKAVDKARGEPRPPVHKHDHAQIVMTPSALDFGKVAIDGQAMRVLQLTNPTGFTLTVISARIESRCFSVSAEPAALPLAIAAHGTGTLTIRFRPVVEGQCSGRLIVDVDSAGGRTGQVSLKGRGIRP